MNTFQSLLDFFLNTKFATIDSYLSTRDEDAEDDRSQSDSENPINEVTAEHAQHNVRPRVEGVECHEIALIYIQVFNHRVLESSRVVIAEVATWNICIERGLTIYRKKFEIDIKKFFYWHQSFKKKMYKTQSNFIKIVLYSMVCNLRKQ